MARPLLYQDNEAPPSSARAQIVQRGTLSGPMTPHPLHYTVVRPPHFDRSQLVVRLLVFVGIGAGGAVVAVMFAAAYLLLPVYAAVRIAALGPRGYAVEDGPRVLRGLEWAAAVCAWFGLVSEDLPRSSPQEMIRIDVDTSGKPHGAGRQLARLVLGLPSALGLAIVALAGIPMWLWAAATVAYKERVGVRTFAYLAGVQRWKMRLLAYQAGLVDHYPPFALADGPSSSPRTDATADLADSPGH